MRFKYYTIKSKRFNLRENGSYASYPIFECGNAKPVATLECYARDVKRFIRIANLNGRIDWKPFFLTQEGNLV